MASLAILIVLLNSNGQAQTVTERVRATLASKMDTVVYKSLISGRSSRVILQARSGYKDLLTARLKKAGIPISSYYQSIDGLVVFMNPRQMVDVCSSIATDRCSVDAEVRASGSPLLYSARKSLSTKSLSSQEASNTALASMGLATNVNGGLGLSVAVIDSGIAPTEALASRIVDFVDFTSGQAQRTDPYDDYGHGTHVAGLVAGQQNQADWAVQGVAPQTNLVGLKVLKADGSGSVSHVISAIDYAVANRERLRIGVINLSLGHPIFEAAETDPMVQAVEAAIRVGIVVVVSAGNYGMNKARKVGYAGITSPGNSPSAITVGAYNHQGTVDRADDVVADYSSRGPSWYDG
jgi:serine protease AprX